MSTAMPETHLEQVTMTDLFPYEDNDDPDHKTHIVNPPMNRHISKGADLSAQEIVDTARMLGLEVVCLCGYRFVPRSNPEKYDACDPCMKAASHLMNIGGE